MGCRCREKKNTTWSQRQARQAAQGLADQQPSGTADAAAAYLAGVNDAAEVKTTTDNS